MLYSLLQAGGINISVHGTCYGINNNQSILNSHQPIILYQTQNSTLLSMCGCLVCLILFASFSSIPQAKARGVSGSSLLLNRLFRGSPCLPQLNPLRTHKFQWHTHSPSSSWVQHLFRMTARRHADLGSIISRPSGSLPNPRRPTVVTSVTSVDVSKSTLRLSMLPAAASRRKLGVGHGCIRTVESARSNTRGNSPSSMYVDASSRILIGDTGSKGPPSSLTKARSLTRVPTVVRTQAPSKVSEPAK